VPFCVVDARGVLLVDSFGVDVLPEGWHYCPASWSIDPELLFDNEVFSHTRASL
jgi:hypothetical protein